LKESERIDRIIKVLESEYSQAKCSLDFETPFELMVATVLSAQCTDKRVNEVTPELFRRYPSPEKMAKASPSDLEKLIQSTGFFRNKAKSLLRASQSLVQDFKGEVPCEMNLLLTLGGVGRKTANVILGNAFGKPAGVVVDTHVTRISRLLGLSKEKSAEKIEKDLNRKIPKEHWVQFPHWLIAHGRAICVARRPQCQKCPLFEFCPRKGLPKLKNRISTYRMSPEGELVATKHSIALKKSKKKLRKI
jgi:endonuclease-3